MDRTNSATALEQTRIWIAVAGAIFLVAIVVAWAGADRPRRIWRSSEVPVAFWAWHSDAPDQSDIDRAINQAGARTLFLRAGQIDFEGGKLHRIREVKGAFPRAIDLHLVYNGTRSLLAAFERLEKNELSEAILQAFATDCVRAESEQVRVAGLHLPLATSTDQHWGLARRWPDMPVATIVTSSCPCCRV
jgi:hypothetical protein